MSQDCSRSLLLLILLGYDISRLARMDLDGWGPRFLNTFAGFVLWDTTLGEDIYIYIYIYIRAIWEVHIFQRYLMCPLLLTAPQHALGLPYILQHHFPSPCCLTLSAYRIATAATLRPIRRPSVCHSLSANRSRSPREPVQVPVSIDSSVASQSVPALQ
jgi:hypothetical protein